jgi:hypothetical protein
MGRRRLLWAGNDCHGKSGGGGVRGWPRGQRGIKLADVIEMLARRFPRLPAQGGPPGGAAPR